MSVPSRPLERERGTKALRRVRVEASRSRRELLCSVIEWRGRALARLMERGRGQSSLARGIVAEIDNLRELLAETPEEGSR